MSLNRLTIVTAFLVICPFAAPQAAQLVSFNVWYQFVFAGAGAAAEGCVASNNNGGLPCDLPNPPSSQPTAGAPAPPWTFDSNSPVEFIVTDVFTYGDAFEVFNGANLILTTPPVVIGGGGCGDDPVICLADPKSSHGSATLFPAQYSSIWINISAYQASNPGYGYFYASPLPIPEPPTALLMAFAVPLLASARLSAKWKEA
jgi:hypothetical protein